MLVGYINLEIAFERNQLFFFEDTWGPEVFLDIHSFRLFFVVSFSGSLLPWKSGILCFLYSWSTKKTSRFQMFACKVLTREQIVSLGNQKEPLKPYKEMYEVLTFHLENVRCFFFIPPVFPWWTVQPVSRPIWSRAPWALWKRVMNSGKVGHFLTCTCRSRVLGRLSNYFRYERMVHPKTLSMCSQVSVGRDFVLSMMPKNVDFNFAQKQLVGVGFSFSDGTMSAAWIINSFMCTGEVDPAMPGSTGVTFILLLTSLVSSSL